MVSPTDKLCREHHEVSGLGVFKHGLFFVMAFLLGVLFCFAALPETAMAGGQAAGLAPPGDCAEPREAVSGVGASTFSVAGAVASLLSPVDVAIGPAPAATLSPPEPSRALARPGACDDPGSGCSAEVLRVPRVLVIQKPIVPGGAPPKSKE